MSSNLESRDMQMSRKLRIIVGMFVMLFGYTSTNIAQPSKRLQIEAVDESEPQVQKQGERWGLFIGIEDYEDPRVTDLRYSIDDVQRITEILRDPTRGAFEHLKVLTSDATEPENRPTRINILRALNRWLAGAKPEDTVFFFFSGHGATDNKNRNYLIPVGAQVDLLEDTALPMERINAILDDREQIAAKKVIVILDSCHSGSKVGQKAFMVEGKILDPLFTDAEGRITFASCDRDESSYEYSDLGAGVFSYYIAEGLKGSGDRDGDGYIDADELFTYVADSVRSWTKGQGDKQTPRKQVNVTGSILVAYHAETLERKRQEAAQQTFNAYKRRLRAIIDLNVTELTGAEKLLERGLMGAALTEAEQQWVQLIRDLADGKISVEIYRLAVRGLDVKGTILVKSAPSSAQITLDNVLQNEPTPMTIEDAIAGPHSLKLTLNGYDDWEQTIHVEVGKPTEINATLVKMQLPQSDPQSTLPAKKGGGHGMLYVIGGAIVTAGGVVGALLFGSGGSEDEPGATTTDDDDDEWPKSDMPLPPLDGQPPQ